MCWIRVRLVLDFVCISTQCGGKLRNHSTMSVWKPYFVLCRIPISFFSAGSAMTGAILFSYHRSSAILIPAAAVFILTCGASALNQYQDREVDGKMERTRLRPLPLGSLRPFQALFFSLFLVLTGLILSASGGGVKAFILGFVAFAWYNGVYTYLKRITAFASVPGAVVGMIPPAIGWVSAGGNLLDTRLVAVCFIFFLWQIPHFWLLLLSYNDEYEQAGLPSISRFLEKAQIARTAFIWIACASLAIFSLPLYGVVRSPFIFFSFIPLTVWLIWNERQLMTCNPLFPLSPRFFRTINIYLFFVMSLLSADKIFSRIL